MKLVLTDRIYWQTLNTDKAATLTDIQRNGTLQRYLGSLIDSKLSFNQQVSNMLFINLHSVHAHLILRTCSSEDRRRASFVECFADSGNRGHKYKIRKQNFSFDTFKLCFLRCIQYTLLQYPTLILAARKRLRMVKSSYNLQYQPELTIGHSD
jgi:hypothetical protein